MFALMDSGMSQIRIVDRGGKVVSETPLPDLKDEPLHFRYRMIREVMGANAFWVGQYGRKTVLKVEAKDTGLVEARIGPSGAGSSGNRTEVTATGPSGITVSANLTSTVEATPVLRGFSLLGAGGSNRAQATQAAVVLAEIGGWADVQAQAGDIGVQAGLAVV